MLKLNVNYLQIIKVRLVLGLDAGARKVPEVYSEKCNVYQEQFHGHFNSEGHNEMEDWKITIIDRAENVFLIG